MTVNTTDIVFLDSIQLTAAVGTDCWGKSKPQLVLASVYLHLKPSFLDACGASDDVTDSVHYGHLAKAVSALVGEKARSGVHYVGVHALIEDVTRAAFELAGESADVVRVVVDLPKQILLASGFTVEVTTPRLGAADTSETGGTGETARNLVTPPAIVRIKDLVLPVLIGVNPPERLARQRVITNITFFERHPHTSFASSEPRPSEIDYSALAQRLYELINTSSHLTLEKLVLELCRACLQATPPAVEMVTVRCEKPSAISFAHVSGVEMTRRREEIGTIG
ncbi:Dihydroneopterin aldolase-domain-containing protein [Scleroderma yunnanense]